MRIIEIPAVEYQQGKEAKHRLYCFAVDGKHIADFATVARVRRDQDTSLFGYQRPEILNHIKEIRTYLEDAENPMIPNAIVVAFDGSVSFSPIETPRGAGPGRLGILRIPAPEGPDERKPGWIVDGQQRTAAIREADVRAFPICVVGFVAASESEQREHFVRVNSAKPLPRDLIFELLPETEGVLSRQLMSKREPARIGGILNAHPDSPFKGRIKMPTCPKGVISYSAVLRMLENSFRDGALYEIATLNSEVQAERETLTFLCDYWTAVAEIFEAAWKLAPKKSRLTHGCGILSVGYLMEEIAHTVGASSKDRRAAFRHELMKIESACAWTSGDWVFADDIRRRWNDIQNTPKDIALITNYLLASYRKTRG
jgi:DGQHR domain-containing protein